MGDSENVLQTSINRGALPPDNPGLDDEEDSAELDSGPLGKASDEANRRTTTVSASNAVGTNAAVAESTMTSAEAVVEDSQKAIDIEDGSEVDRNKMVDVSGEETTKDEDGKSSVDPVTDADVSQMVLCVTSVTNYAAEGTDQTDDPLEKDPEVDQAERKEAVENTDYGALSSFQQHLSSRNAFTGLACSSSFGLGEDLGEKISSGTYSDLYKSTYVGKHMRTKRDVAVKVLKLDCIQVEEIVKQIHSMSQLEHRICWSMRTRSDRLHCD